MSILGLVVPGRELRVFLVEDSPAFVDAIRDLLSEIPGVSIAGSSGQPLQAIAEIRRLTPDVVILDLQLETGTGLDVLRHLKSAGEKHPVAIVFSSSVDSGYRRASQRLKADYILDKSTDYAQLAHLIRELATDLQANPD